MSSRRSPGEIALAILKCVEEKGEATKWDLLKVVGNDVQFRNWIEDFLIPEGVLIERRDGRHYFFKKSEFGETFHRFLRNGNVFRLYSRLSGRRLK